MDVLKVDRVPFYETDPRQVAMIVFSKVSNYTIAKPAIIQYNVGLCIREIADSLGRIRDLSAGEGRGRLF